MTDSELQGICLDFGAPLTDSQVRKISAYESLLASWSERVRLVSRGDVEQLRDRHIVDCLRAVPFLDPGPLLDLGSGGGLPGIPIKIAEPERIVHLVESARMKSLFLRHVIEEVGLEGGEVIHERVEALHGDPERREAYGSVTARAVADLDKLWKWSQPLLRPNGVLVALKGPAEGEQWQAAENWAQVGDVTVDVVEVPPAGRKRAIVRIRKA